MQPAREEMLSAMRNLYRAYRKAGRSEDAIYVATVLAHLAGLDIQIVINHEEAKRMHDERAESRRAQCLALLN